jgi:radical SAM protein
MKLDERPFIAIWETTQACDLACAHCRACARPARDSGELDTAAARALLGSFARARVPLVVLTGGDPAKRPDLIDLIRYGRELGLHMGLTPSATPLVTGDLVGQLADAGLSRLAISIDGPNAEVHDAFRGVGGSFDQSLRILEDARQRGIATQINTSIYKNNISQLSEIADVVAATGAILWSVFFVVPLGRASQSMLPDAETVESALEHLADIAEQGRFSVKTTAAPQYRRILLQRRKREGEAAEYGVFGKRSMRVNDGRGFVFVSHRGEIYPSGFLPIACGNVRNHDVLDVYRNHPVFRALRDAEALTGKCGACEYRNVCGGSRARAYAMRGSILAPDPSCSYVPPGYVAPSEPVDRRRMLDVVE